MRRKILQSRTVRDLRMHPLSFLLRILVWLSDYGDDPVFSDRIYSV